MRCVVSALAKITSNTDWDSEDANEASRRLGVADLLVEVILGVLRELDDVSEVVGQD